MDALERMFCEEEAEIAFFLREEFTAMTTSIAIPMEDPIIHTDDYPFCSDVHCPCHDIQNGQYYELICRPLLDGLMTADEANRLYFGDDLPPYEEASKPTPLTEQDYEDFSDYEPYYSRADQAADEATADYYDEVQRRQETRQCSDGSWW